MKAETDIEKNASLYEDFIRKELDTHLFDLVMLGLGEDGHTASLFPHTAALKEQKKLVVTNYISEKNIWRMTFTFPCIQQSQKAVFYVLGENKQAIVPLVLEAAIVSPFPASTIGTVERKALWILEQSAARLLKESL
jgi:6-phosphogluconolactonase